MPSFMRHWLVLLQHLLPQQMLSRLMGLVANSRIRWVKNTFIRLFIRRYQPNLAEAESEDINHYASFNAFFTRALKVGARPVSGLVCSPADGVVSACGPILKQQLIQAKRLDYSLQKLLATRDTAVFERGSFVTLYLAPKDYHRVHCPMPGILLRARYIPGKLFSVNQATTNGVRNLFAINERLIMEFDTHQGKLAVIMVGAMIVSAIKPVWRETAYQAGVFVEETFDAAPMKFAAGAELGEFQMGSTAIIVTEQPIHWSCQTSDAVKMGRPLMRA